MYAVQLSYYAEIDIIEAFEWYAEIANHLGRDFLNKMDHCFRAISKNPQHFQEVSNGIRRGLLDKFPYAVFFEVWKEQIYVFGVIHTSRDPETYRNR